MPEYEKSKSAGTETLDGLFLDAVTAPPQVPDALMQRVLSDAQAVQRDTAARPRTDHRAGIRAQLRTAFGGWAGIGGLVAATCAGFWIGVSPPQNLPDPSAWFLTGVSNAALAYENMDSDFASLTGFGWTLEES